MNYPVWELYASGGGLLIVIIAVLHVYIAHFAVGGGLYLVLCEYKANREQQDDLFAYIHKHAKFFMLLTMVLGGVTGVGIWFTMALLSPEATSILIHQFVFAWAVEWVFFTGEIVALFIYYYTFNRVTKDAHMRIGWIYFGFAWLSLFVVNGIISFMLTPGKWLETGLFWHALFNPGFFPALFFRTALTIVFAGIFGLLTAIFIENLSLRNQQIRYCGRWILSGLLSLPVFAHFYFYSMPEASEAMIRGGAPEIQSIVILFLILFLMLILCAGVLFFQLSNKTQKMLSVCLLIMGLIFMGSFEWIREASRKPYIINNYLYANQIYEKDTARLQTEGLLKNAKWVQNKTITCENILEAGHELFLIACSNCHSVGGPMNDILPLTKKYSNYGMEALLTGQGKITTYMPVFQGTSTERNALAQYIVEELHQKTSVESQAAMITLTHCVPSFNKKTDQYVLLSWPNKGMHLYSDCEKSFQLGLSKGTIHAQLILRNETPEHISEDIEMIYRSKKQNVEGLMNYDDMAMAFVAKNVPLSEFDSEKDYNPYPIFTIEARRVETKEIIAKTQVVVAVSSNMGCKNCHGGPWKNNESSGISKQTARDILKTHDRISGTDLVASAQKGKAQTCADCHKSASSNILNLSSSMHGFHANYISNPSADTCIKCHASFNNNSLCLRGRHAEFGLSCVSCHGSLTDHALGLLAHEIQNGKISAKRYIKHLTPSYVASKNEIKPRKPWVHEPDCTGCHVNYEKPEPDISGFNRWTTNADNLFRNQMGDAGIRCTACHGAPHALYPTKNIFDQNRDNIQPLQYQMLSIPIGGNELCSTCHMTRMDENYHHENMMK
ncbi:cytochrome C [Candidatus Magnetomorum sp. HK-1]|nr:cytochrome C [Candidatus Magnetomorum sp. HK-1]